MLWRLVDEKFKNLFFVLMLCFMVNYNILDNDIISL